MNIKKTKDIIKMDKKVYLGEKSFIYLFIKHQNIIYYKALKYNRLYRYYKLNQKTIFNKFLLIYYTKKKNTYCNNYSVELNGANIGKNFKIFHNNIVINEKSIIQNNCRLHGNNCIGNNGIDNKCPIIGNNVDIGYGSVIIGDIKIVDNITVGANSVVVNSLTQKNAVYAGCPARFIRKKNDKVN